jgi:hypothetical protein
VKESIFSTLTYYSILTCRGIRAVANEEKILEKRVGYEDPVQALAAIGADKVQRMPDP